MNRLHLICAIAICTLSSWCYGAWTSAHGNVDNTGFAQVATAPAVFENQIGFANVGTVAPGANPVTAPDGTVYIGNLEGELIALHADGTPYWKRQLGSSDGVIMASPVIGADGSIYVVSGRSLSVPLHGGGNATRGISILHKFSAGGAWLFAAPFPVHFPTQSEWMTRGLTSAPPNIWRYDNIEVVMVPVYVATPGGFAIHLLAFNALSGAVLADHRVNHRVYDLMGYSPIMEALESFFTFSFSVTIPPWIVPPMPGVAIVPNSGGSPWIWMADNVSSTVALKFDPSTGFEEIYRFRDPGQPDRHSSAPMALPNVIAVVGTADGYVKFERDSIVLSGYYPISATPTRMADGRIAIVSGNWISVLSGGAVAHETQLSGRSIASVAASCNHVFAASENELVTFDAKTMTRVATLPWTDGGAYPPIIGPLGHVYGMTKWGLFVFAPPPTSGRPARPYATCGRIVRLPSDAILSNQMTNN